MAKKDNIIDLQDYYHTWKYVIHELEGTIDDMAIMHNISKEFCLKVMLLAVRVCSSKRNKLREESKRYEGIY